jgi:acylphosphatase
MNWNTFILLISFIPYVTIIYNPEQLMRYNGGHMKKVLSVFLAALFMFACLPAAAAGSDVTGPELNFDSISMNKTSFNVGETLSVTFKATDDLSGIDLSKCYVNFSGNSRGAGLTLRAGTEADTYIGECSLSEDYFPSGTYRIDSFKLTDNSNNSTGYTVWEKTMSAYEFTITNKIRTDWTGPVPKSVSLQIVSGSTGAKKTYAEPGDKLCFSATAYDPKGVSQIFVSFRLENNIYWGTSVQLNESSSAPGLFYGEYILPKYQPDGQHEICGLWMFDGLSNTSDYRIDPELSPGTNQLPANMNIKFDVKNPGVGPERKQNPMVADFSISPQNIKAGEPVTFTVKVDARGNELRDRMYIQVGYYTWNYMSRPGIELKKVSDGVYTNTFTFPGSWPCGKYDVSSGDVMTGEFTGSPLDWPASYYAGFKFQGPSFTVDSVYSGTQDVTLPVGAPEFDIMAGVSAGNSVEGDLTGKIEAQGSVDTSKPGLYLIKYKIPKEATPYFYTTSEYYYDFRWVGVTEIMPDPAFPDAPLAITDDSLAVGADATDVSVELNGKSIAFAKSYAKPGEYALSEKMSVSTTGSGLKGASVAVSSGKAKAFVDKAGPAISYTLSGNKKKFTVNVKALDVAGVKLLKCMPGKQTQSTVLAKGYNILAKKSFSLTNNGIYTFVAQDKFGNYACKTFDIKFIPASKLYFSVRSGAVYIGKTYKTSLRFSPSNVSTKSVTYKSSNTKIATVDKKGVVKALKKGTVTITATATDGSGRKATIRIAVKPVLVSSLAFTKSAYTMYTGKTYTTSLKVSPTNATTKGVTYKSSNTRIASVDKKGVVKALKKGTVTITATATDGSRKKATIKITVK